MFLGDFFFAYLIMRIVVIWHFMSFSRTWYVWEINIFFSTLIRPVKGNYENMICWITRDFVIHFGLSIFQGHSKEILKRKSGNAVKFFPLSFLWCYTEKFGIWRQSKIEFSFSIRPFSEWKGSKSSCNTNLPKAF